MSPIPRIKDKIFYGWIITAATSIIAATLMGTRFSFGVFFKSIESEFELSRAATSSVFSVYMIICAAFAVLSGWALDRYGPKPVALLMGLFTGASLLLTSQANSLWQIYLSYSLAFAAGTGGTVPMATATVSRWFERKRGLAIGLTNSGQRVGVLAIAPLSAYLISTFDWRTSYVVLGLIALLTVLPLSMLIRKDPQEMGLLPDGASLRGKTSKTSDIEESTFFTGVSLRQALATRNFWLLMAVIVMLSFSSSLIMTHIVPYATDTGISIIEASTILSVMSGIGILAGVVVGRISDTAGRKAPGIICAIIGAGALAWLTLSGDLWALYVFAIAFGFAFIGLAVACLALVSDIYKGRSLGTIMGVQEIGVSAGAATGAVIGGLIFDATSSYATAFLTAAAAMLATAFLFALIRTDNNA